MLSCIILSYLVKYEKDSLLFFFFFSLPLDLSKVIRIYCKEGITAWFCLFFYACQKHNRKAEDGKTANAVHQSKYPVYKEERVLGGLPAEVGFYKHISFSSL